MFHGDCTRNVQLPFLNGSYRNGVCREFWAKTVASISKCCFFSFLRFLEKCYNQKYLFQEQQMIEIVNNKLRIFLKYERY